jgi:hypothetical protein
MTISQEFHCEDETGLPKTDSSQAHSQTQSICKAFLDGTNIGLRLTENSCPFADMFNFNTKVKCVF